MFKVIDATPHLELRPRHVVERGRTGGASGVAGELRRGNVIHLLAAVMDSDGQAHVRKCALEACAARLIDSAQPPRRARDETEAPQLLQIPCQQGTLIQSSFSDLHLCTRCIPSMVYWKTRVRDLPLLHLSPAAKRNVVVFICRHRSTWTMPRKKEKKEGWTAHKSASRRQTRPRRERKSGVK